MSILDPGTGWRSLTCWKTFSSGSSCSSSSSSSLLGKNRMNHIESYRISIRFEKIESSFVVEFTLVESHRTESPSQNWISLAWSWLMSMITFFWAFYGKSTSLLLLAVLGRRDDCHPNRPFAIAINTCSSSSYLRAAFHSMELIIWVRFYRKTKKACPKWALTESL